MTVTFTCLARLSALLVLRTKNGYYHLPGTNRIPSETHMQQTALRACSEAGILFKKPRVQVLGIFHGHVIISANHCDLGMPARAAWISVGNRSILRHQQKVIAEIVKFVKMNRLLIGGRFPETVLSPRLLTTYQLTPEDALDRILSYTLQMRRFMVVSSVNDLVCEHKVDGTRMWHAEITVV